MASIRGRSIDNINKKYARGSSYSPPGISAIQSQNVVVSNIAQPLVRASTVVTGTPVSIMQKRTSAYAVGSDVRSVSPTYTAGNTINYPSISTEAAQALISGPTMQQQTIRRSTVVVPRTVQVAQPVVQPVVSVVQPVFTGLQHPISHPPTQLIEPTTSVIQYTSGLIPIDRKVVEVVETRTPGDVTKIVETHGGHVVQTPSIPIRKSRCYCPAWLWLLLLLPLLLGGLYGLFNWFNKNKTDTKGTVTPVTPVTPVGPNTPVTPVRPRPVVPTTPYVPISITRPHSTIAKTEYLDTHRITEVETVNNTVTIDTEKCSPGFFYYNNECVRCPSQSAWNGTHCVIKKLTKVITTKTKEIGLEPKYSYGSSLGAGSLSTTNTIFGWAASSSSGSSSSSQQSSSYTTSSGYTKIKTVGEYMEQLGLDYNSMKKKWQSEGWSGTVSNESQGANLVVEPIVEKHHHLRRQ